MKEVDRAACAVVVDWNTDLMDAAFEIRLWWTKPLRKIWTDRVDVQCALLHAKN
jgi:hypothetical protein